MKIFKQIIREFSIPFLISVAWVIYNSYGTDGKFVWDIKNVVNVFGPTFFLLSWMTGQFFRVKKQTKVEDSFATIENRFDALIGILESKTKEMIAHVSGGDSYPWLQLSSINSATDTGLLMIIHHGEHPLYDVEVRISDLQKMSSMKGRITLETLKFIDKSIKIGTMIPSHAQMLTTWKIEASPEQSYNAHFVARNGSFTQLMRLKKINGEWTCATRVSKRGGEVLHEQIDRNFPRNNEGQVDWA